MFEGAFHWTGSVNQQNRISSLMLVQKQCSFTVEGIFVLLKKCKSEKAQQFLHFKFSWGVGPWTPQLAPNSIYNFKNHYKGIVSLKKRIFKTNMYMFIL